MGDARTLAEEHYAAINAVDMDRAMAVHADDAECSAPGLPSTRGADKFRAFAQPFLTAFPNPKMYTDNLIEAGDTVMIEGRFTGENTGPLMTPAGELPATGKHLELRFADVMRAENGKIVAHHVYFDQAEFMQQLGLMPDPTQR